MKTKAKQYSVVYSLGQTVFVEDLQNPLIRGKLVMAEGGKEYFFKADECVLDCKELDAISRRIRELNADLKLEEDALSFISR